MKVGLVATTGSAAQVVDHAAAADEHGWDGWFTWDGLALAGYESWDPWAVLAAAAVRTTRVTLGALVFAPARRRPWVLAKQAVTVDHLSGGRLVIPVGLGVNDDRAFSGVQGEAVDVRDKAARLDETLELMDRAFSGEAFSAAGAHYRVTDLQLLPRPVQRPRVPVWVVAAFPSERSMGRAVRWDGVVPQLRGDRAQDPMAPADVAAVARWAAEHREASRGPFDIVVQGVLPEDDREATDRLAGLEEAGATWFVHAEWDQAKASPEQLLERARRGVPGRV